MKDIDETFRVIKRVNFVPEESQEQAQLDSPLSIGFGQTISQPTTVAYMLEWLAPEMGDKVLDVGSGSGWTSALLSYLVGKKGQVYAVERIPELVEFGKNNCQKLGLLNIRFFKSGHEYGLPRYAPYDRILVSAAAKELPRQLLEQLKVGGKLVIPVRSDILEITKNSKADCEIIRHPGFAFVSLVVH